jgi:hypothetical protein
VPVAFTTPDPESDKKRERPQKLIFSIDEKDYTIPADFTAAEGLTFVDLLRRQGTDVATAWALEYALGTEGYRALLVIGAHPDHDERFREVCNIVVAEVSGKRFGVSTAPKEPPAPKPEPAKPAKAPSASSRARRTPRARS